MSTETTTRQLAAVLADLAAVLDGIGPDAASRPTPCRDFDVAALRRHVVGWLTAFTDGFEASDGECSDPAAVGVEGTGADQVRALAGRLATVLPAAADRPLRIGGGEMPGDLSLSMILWEYLMHGWDLATATGQRWAPAQDAVDATLEFAPAMLTPDTQGQGKMFGPAVEVPAHAPALDRLLGLAGRDPRWRA